MDFAVLGYAAGLVALGLALLASVLFVIPISQGKVTPVPVTWLVITGINALFVLVKGGQAHGHWDQLLVPAGYFVGASAVLLASIRYAKVEWNPLHWSFSDQVSATIASLGAVVWFYHHQSPYALPLLIVANFAGTWPTLRADFHRPQPASYPNWRLCAIATVLNLTTISGMHFSGWIYQAYFLCVNMALAAFNLPSRAKRTGE